MTPYDHARPGAVPNTVPFFTLAFAITWGMQVPALAARNGLLPGPTEAYLPFAMLGVLGPMIAATWLVARSGGRRAVSGLFSGMRLWRASPLQWAMALAIPGTLLSGALVLSRAIGYSGPVVLLPEPERLVAGAVIAVAEEIAWRGYALPRLQARYGAFAASGMLGALWTVWHIPMFMGLGVPLTVLPWMFLFFIGGSLLFTWLFNRSGGSLMLVTVAHYAANLNNSHAALPDNVVPLIYHSLIYAALGLGIALCDRYTFPELRKRRHRTNGWRQQTSVS
ncbi:MAG: type II CAAX endopeptidase family protein [Myxococcales bacterium]|nr:type II CAAX endopeptidase family protein [Myxococcales bacterium]